MRKFVLLILAVLMTGAVFAQNRQVSGTVTNESGEPVIGAAVSVQGTNAVAVTGVDGSYTISAPANGTLVAQFIGMSDVEVAIGGRSVVDIEMDIDAKIVETITISVPYGSVDRASYNGSASSVATVATLKDLPGLSFEGALQGSAPGVSVGSRSGQPGQLPQIRIRGTGSVNASNDPLYVVDGVPVSSGDYDLVSYGGSMSMMSTINPSDIESMTILKDAAATSLYGSRGANGVIMITTKKGQSGDLKIDFKASWGFNDFAMDYRPVLGGEESHYLAYEGAYNQGIFNGMNDSDAKGYAQGLADQYYPLRDEYADWEDALMRKGRNSAYEVSLSGGDARTQFYTSLAYREDQGVYLGSEMSGFTGKGSLTHQNKGWTVNFETLFAKMEQQQVPGMDAGGSVAYANPYYATRNFLKPNTPIYDENGNYTPFQSPLSNIVEVRDKESNSNNPFRFRNSLAVGYELIDGLTLKNTVSYDYNHIEGIDIAPSDSPTGEELKGITARYSYMDNKFYNSLVLNYNTKFGADHDFSAMAGWDVDQTLSTYLAAQGVGFATPDLWEIDNSSTPRAMGSYHNNDNLMAFFGSANYSYKSRYNVSATIRRDGSSRLGENVKWGNFWSVAGSWRISAEEWMKDVNWVDNLRLRASYGTSGTLPSSLYSSLATYSFSGISYNDNGGSIPSRSANPNLGWEKNSVLDVAVEARLFDRLDIEVDFYDRQTNDLLLSMPISWATGFSSTLMNVGGMNNRGVEILLGYDVFKGGDFTWHTQLAAAYNRNKVTSLVNHEDMAHTSNTASFMAREGESFWSIWMRDYAGIDPGTGETMWYIWEKDDNGEFTGEKYVTKDPNLSTREIQAHTDPHWTGGWSNTLAWKGFDLNFLFSFVAGGTSYDAGFAFSSNDGTVSPGEGPIAKIQTDRWQKPGDKADHPKRMWGGGHGNYTSSRWLHSTDHVRLKTLSFGYTVPQRLTEKVGVRNLRAFVAGNNLLTWAAYKDYDPEVQSNGVSDWSIPVLKSVTFGVELGF